MKKREFPILEFDSTKESIIEPSKVLKPQDISEYCVVCFFQDVINKVIEEHNLEPKIHMRSEMGLHPIYELDYKDNKINIFHPGMGAPFAAAALEEVIVFGGRKFVACGGAGVLKEEISVGSLIIPDSAIRDEGVSYHYLPPSREVESSSKAINSIVNTLEEEGIKYITFSDYAN